MTVPRVLNKSVEKQITDDWHRELPNLGIYKPRWLMRRVGPLLVGICLDRDSGGDVYKPIFHVHCLGKEAPAVFLTLLTQLRSERSGGPDFVQVRFHDEKYKEAAARMVRQSLLPLEGDLTFEQIIAAYRTYLQSSWGRLTPVLLYRDMIILLAWGGRQVEALKFLAQCLRLERQTDLVSDDAAFRQVGGRTAFEVECRKLIDNPALIQQTLDSQIAALGVGNLPTANLIWKNSDGGEAMAR
jgi:hypothetical protein